MKRLIWLLVLLAYPALTPAQTTTVFATVVDANGNPYANGTVSAALAMPVGIAEATLISDGTPVNQHSGPFALDGTGHFSIPLTSNDAMNPAGTQWSFTVCGIPVNIGPRGNVAPVQICFNANTTFSITGASLSLTTQLNAVAKLLGPAVGTGTGPGTCAIGLSGPGGLFGITGTPAACNGVLGFTTTGPSGSIPFFIDGLTLAPSAALTQNAYIAGGGPGVAPFSGTITDDLTNPPRSPNGLNLASQYLGREIANANPGTTAQKLACISGATSTVTVCPTTPATGTVRGIAEVGAGNSGTVVVATSGRAQAIFDNQTTIGDFAIPSTTVAGDLHDIGSTTPAAGLNYAVDSTNAGAGTAAFVIVPGDSSIGSSGGGLVSCLTTLGDVWTGGAAGVCTRVGAPTSPDGLFQFFGSASASGLPTSPVYKMAGISYRAVTAATDTAVFLDRAAGIHWNRASGAAGTQTIPQAGTTNFSQNFPLYVYDLGLGPVTVTPTTSTINLHASVKLYYGDFMAVASDNTNYTARITRAGHTCNIPVGTDDGPVLVDTNLGPQGGLCQIPYNATVYEIDVKADGGTPSVIPRVEHVGGSTSALLSGALATAAAGAFACSNANGTLSVDGTTTCTNTLQNTALVTAEYLGLTSGTAGGVAKRMSITIWFGVAP